jgi:hypothetical protein
MNGPKHVIVGTNTLLVKDGAFRPAGGDGMMEFSSDEIDWMILTGAARPAQVGDVVVIDGLTLEVKAVVE